MPLTQAPTKVIPLTLHTNECCQPALDPCSWWPSAAAGSVQPCLLLSALGSIQREGGATARYTDCSRSPVVQPCRQLPSHSLPMVLASVSKYAG